MTQRSSDKPMVSRRAILGAAATGAVALVGGALGGRQAFASPQETADLVGKLAGGKAPQEGRVALKLPQIAENGNTVPVTVTVDSPMSDSDYVKAVHILADDNPTPNVATFHFTPASGKAEVSVRMRLAKTQNVIALAEMNDGSVYMGKQEIKVTIGGCGG